MRIYRSVRAHLSEPCVLTIGNFDGVHLGHKALLAQLRARADATGLPATVLCFEPHPREFFAPDSAPPRLCSMWRKMALLQAAGVDQICMQRFDARFSGLSAQEFIEQVLVQGMQVRHLMIGDDFRFGRGRDGDFSTLLAAGERHGFAVEAMTTQTVSGERVSSSAVREALQGGEIEHATRLLGEPFVVEGWVQHGDKIGRTIGFPTANIRMRQQTLPLSGIFAVTVDGGPLRHAIGAASIGYRPTIGAGLGLRVEVFVLDFSGDLYGERLSVRFWHKLRDEKKYDTLDALKAAIGKDCDDVRAWFSTHPEYLSLREQHG
ncbi:MAG: riboflavin biosynthesis protein RibF [Candidatus Dactylopiibacterium carminicum]|uniref:Riboflavin biosynthesis protein n=1 Tax=Candidatus Dactylopiibacterium carminicum TaxID=857335 RepID=A0A272EW96_9RHOO|nr:bifunctional riboflavin kinase/FAD synthetase [Candidatus Dactylopiibacterium carminicum]KAF7599819.1 bifunctional riboflavin kinase/FAD synthetase [Candidatus Dactylopiibacterium carminicum]PAS93930.1 MAG: riboflavin biosynthesis protein RibF [Candidatus Dactylopiibacterium carminicum]PAS97245.1 MAG: riboflavin biosynthesis protein RibF [Candidatus Dactylopiibacterium carminicum]PAS99821.1 MAG: riboflavin biosynthesis protein RibF [Candidatus Dactylopiibacterium carminicum]